MKALTSRRAALGAILSAPLGSVSLAAASRREPPSDLASACEWASNQWSSLHARCRAEDWDDDRLNAESELYYAVFDRALAEPSRTLSDLKAKARLCLTDFEAQVFPWLDPAENSEPDDAERMVMTVLRELIALVDGAV